MSQTQTVGTHATTVARQAGVLRVTYHATVVVEVMPDGTIRLDSGGWRTPTTRTRMNQAANQYDLGFSVFQKNYTWFVSYNGHHVPFYDGMTFRTDGEDR